MSDELTGMAAIPRWIQRDPKVSWKAKAVYIAINSRIGEHGAAFPSHATIAEDCGVSITTVKQGIRELEDMGVLAKSSRFQETNGQTSNEYTLALHRPRAAVDPGRDTPTPRASDAYPPGRDTPTKDSISKDSTEERSKDLLPEFEAFWKVYPIRVGKGTALTAFTKARKKAPLAEILAGAERYRNDPNRTDGYTKHPSTWLNSQGWLDEALPSKVPSATIPAGQAAPKSRTDEHLDMVAYYARLETQNQLPGIES